MWLVPETEDELTEWVIRFRRKLAICFKECLPDSNLRIEVEWDQGRGCVIYGIFDDERAVCKTGQISKQITISDLFYEFKLLALPVDAGPIINRIITEWRIETDAERQTERSAESQEHS